MHDAFADVLRPFVCDIDTFHCAYSNVFQEYAGAVVRDYTYGQVTTTGDTVFSLPYLTASAYNRTKPVLDASRGNVGSIIFGPYDFHVVSPSDIDFSSRIIKDKIVMLGALGEESDMHFTPIGNMSGLRLQAYATQSIADHNDIKVMPVLLVLLLSLVVCFMSEVVGYHVIKWSPDLFGLWLKLYYFALIALLVWGAFLCYVKCNYNIPLMLPLCSLALVETSRFIYIWTVRTLRKRTRWSLPQKSIYLTE